MRPYFVLCAVLLIAISAFGQDMGPRHHSGPFLYGYGYGTDAPLVTTPMLSLETVTENPVGASNATTGLVAGATNATVSQLLSGSTSSNYTVGVWYQGGSPLITPQVNTWPIPREGYGMRGHEMGEEHGAMEREHMAHHEKHAEWTYFSGPEYTTPVASAAKGPGPGKHAYTNDDVTRQNNNNGSVKYDGKTEKIQ
jgi:hypothetical protein